jgi:hypothetical protein
VLEPVVEEPVKSVVTVEFDNGKEYPYYNDKFNLKVGDIVFVDGKLAGKAGRVVKVTTKFKISLKYYKFVVAKLNLDIHGSFAKVESFMLCKGNNVVPFEQIKSWFVPPVANDEDEEEFILGEGYECPINDISLGDEIDSEEWHEAIETLVSNNVKFITVNNGIGHAIVKNHKTHIVDFTIADGRIKDIFCDCIKPDFCRHAVAVCLAIDTFIEENHIEETDDFSAIDINLFHQIIGMNDTTITV